MTARIILHNPTYKDLKYANAVKNWAALLVGVVSAA